jgi:hypothetical protein
MRELRERKITSEETLLTYITAIESMCHDLDENMNDEKIVDNVYAAVLSTYLVHHS